MPTHSYGFYDPQRAANFRNWYNHYLSLGCGTGKAFDVAKRKENKLFVSEAPDGHE